MGSVSRLSGISAAGGRLGGSGVVTARTCSAFAGRGITGRAGCETGVAPRWKKAVGSWAAERPKPWAATDRAGGMISSIGSTCPMAGSTPVPTDRAVARLARGEGASDESPRERTMMTAAWPLSMAQE